MKIKNLTVFPAAGIVTSTRPPAPEMSFVVRAKLRLVPGGVAEELPLLEQGKLSAETFAEDDDERAGGALTPSDFADLKPKAEIVVKATCHTPKKAELAECPVRVKLGAWQKMLRVVGRRVWRKDVLGRASDPAPFTKMPLDWSQSFGGPGYARNPSGKGFETLELPCIEDPGAPVRSPSDRPEPAGFGPLNPAWPQRSDKRGKEYGRSYQKERAPYYAVDFDWSFFNAAPPDQRLDALVGDEELLLQNLHPTEPLLVTRLPGLRIRAFVMDVEDRFREMKMRLDTVFVDADEGTVALSYRGLDAVKDDDLADVRTVLVAKERLSDAPLPEAHYRALLDEFEKDPLGMRAVIEKSAPNVDADAFVKGEIKLKEPPAESKKDDAVDAIFGRRLLAVPPDARGAVKEQLGRLLADTTLGQKLRDALEARAKEPRPKIIPPVLIASPDALVAAQRTAIRPALPRIAETKERAASFPQLSPKQAAKVAELEKLEALVPKPATGAPGPGADLSWQDRSGEDLSGVDLTGANLEGTFFVGTKLRGAKLVGARLREAVFFDADLTDADLSEAALDITNFACATLDGARLDRATLDRSSFDKATAVGASFVEARGVEAIFTKAALSRADFSKATLVKPRMTGAKLDRAKLDGAKLEAAWLDRADGEGASFVGANVGGSNFGESKLSDATFERARGERPVFLKAVLDRANFGRATMPDAIVDQASAVGARFFGADLRGARFYRATLEGADFTRANLLGVDLRKTKLGSAKMRDANLFEAKLLGASGSGVDFLGANLKRARMTERT